MGQTRLGRVSIDFVRGCVALSVLSLPVGCDFFLYEKLDGTDTHRDTGTVPAEEPADGSADSPGESGSGDDGSSTAEGSATEGGDEDADVSDDGGGSDSSGTSADDGGMSEDTADEDGDETAVGGDESDDGGTTSGASSDGGEADTGGMDDGEETEGIDGSMPYNEAIFRATHNSYSGGDKRSIVEQLDEGIRQIEFDFHDNDYAERGFQLGHTRVGDHVSVIPPNPDTYELGAWLQVVADWSDANPDHTPVHVLLDIKDDMTDNRRTDEGSFAALNERILSVLGDRVFWSRSRGDEWPSVDSLRGKVIVGLSGGGTMSSRRAYVRDRGVDAAVAMNDHGQIIEVHKSESHDTLWFWTGQMQDDGSVIWQHHGRFDDGRNPSIALNNHGWFVEVHRSHADDDLWSWVGHIGPTGDLEFYENAEINRGRLPSIDFVNLDGWDLREIHQSSSTDDVNWYLDMRLDSSSRSIVVGAHDTTGEARYDTTHAESEAGHVNVWSADEFDEDTLFYSTDRTEEGRIRYAQVAFVDTFSGDPVVLTAASDFRSFSSGSTSDAMSWSAMGGMARIWSFDEDDALSMTIPPTFGATDTPFADWYRLWSEEVGAFD